LHQPVSDKGHPTAAGPVPQKEKTMTAFKPLALRVPHQPPAYFAARLAARNLRPARLFTRDLGLDFQRLADGCEANVRKLADLGGADYQALIGCALRKQEGKIELKGQELRKSGLRRARTHVCPKCLLEDIANSDLPPHLAIHGRANWLLASIRTCPIHEVALLQVARDVPVHDTHDWTTNVAPVVPLLPQFADLVTHRPASALELYLFERLAGRPTTSWLDAFPFFAAALVAELIGAVATAGKKVNLDELSEDARHEAGHAGAEIANAGLDALVEFMTKLRKEHRPKKKAGGPAAIFGKLYMTPAQGLSDPAYDPLREVMGSFILKTFALGPGDELFGRPVTERRLHSIRSASKEYGIHRSRLRKLIEAEGLISDPNAPDGDVLFDAQHADRIFKREQNLVTMRDVARHLNAGRVQTDMLFQAGFIKRHSTGSGMKEYFLRPELDEFLSRLLASAAPVRTVPAHVAGIAKAARRARCFMAEIVQAILDGKLTWVGRRQGIAGFASVLVDVEEIKTVTRLEDPPGLPVDKTARKVLKTSGPVLAQLIRSGAIKTITAINPVNRCPTRFIRFDEIERFQSEYVSLYHLARSQGLFMPVLKKNLLAKGITPVDFAGVKATFYRRADVDPVVPSA
jgi:hypothetical protein